MIAFLEELMARLFGQPEPERLPVRVPVDKPKHPLAGGGERRDGR